nr:hypothetical protein [Klebsiella pneumoniae subsp. pneumoniae]
MEAVMTRRLVVIGNGMAATRLVQRLVERDPRGLPLPSSATSRTRPITAFSSPLLAGEKRRRRSRCCRRVVHPARGVPAVWRGGR